jgi:predicted dehydrogenase
MSKNQMTRRSFLQTTTGATGAAMIAGKQFVLESEPIPYAWEKPVAASDRVRFGIIGVGMQGNGLLATAITLPGVECVAAADLYDGRHTLAKEIAGPKITTTRQYKELLNNQEIDCIIAAVPDHWHKQVFVDTLHAGKDIYLEKPMSHSAAEGVEMVATAKTAGRIVQIGSQRVSSVICAKAKEMLAQGAIGDLNLVEGSLGRNDPTGAWEYPVPTDLSTQTLDWETWQGTVPKRAFNGEVFARWRCWKEYGTGVAGDLLVHLVSGMNFMLGWNEPPATAMSIGGILRFPDGRNMPDVQATVYQYGKIPVYLRLNLGCETPEMYRFQGSKGILEATEFGLAYYPQTGEDSAPSYYATSFPREMREAYYKKWHEEHDPAPGKEPLFESYAFKGDDWDDLRPHLWNYFQAVRSRKSVVEDAVFGHNAALACHMANQSYFRKAVVTWDPGSAEIKNYRPTGS